MGAKLLFIVGIIVAHGALAAGWVAKESPKQRVSIATCVRAPEVMPHYSPPRELLALADIPIVDLQVIRR